MKNYHPFVSWGGVQAMPISEEKSVNAAVARKLGWNPPGPPPDSPTWKKPDGSYDFVPPYSTEIKAAWEIVEKQHRVKLEYLLGEWQCQIDDEFAATDTAPMAICLAFLKLINTKGLVD